MATCKECLQVRDEGGGQLFGDSEQLPADPPADPWRVAFQSPWAMLARRSALRQVDDSLSAPGEAEDEVVGRRRSSGAIRWQNEVVVRNGAICGRILVVFGWRSAIITFRPDIVNHDRLRTRGTVVVFFSGDVGAVAEEEAVGEVHAFSDADARASDDVGGADGGGDTVDGGDVSGGAGDEQFQRWGGQVVMVERSGDGQGLCQSAGSGGEFGEFVRLGHVALSQQGGQVLQSAEGGHDGQRGGYHGLVGVFQTCRRFVVGHRFGGADQDGFADARGPRDDVDRPVHAVGEIDVRVSRRAEHGCVAR